MLAKIGMQIILRQKIGQTFMMIRKIKPSKIDSQINSKLKSARFIEQINFTSQIQNDRNKQPEINSIQQIKNEHFQNVKNSDSEIQQKNVRQTKQIKKLESHKQISAKKELTQQGIKLKKALKTLGKALQPINTKSLKKKQLQDAAIEQNNQIIQSIQDMKSLPLKEFSVLIHRLLVNSININSTVQKYIWKQIQQSFLNRFQMTTEPQKIRSYSKIIYCLAKSKIHRQTSSSSISTSITTNLKNFQTKFALLLPFASHQSFGTIITSLSRMGPLSQQFSYIAERLYYSKYNQLNVRQKVQINYALTRNGKKVDTNLINFIELMNLKQIMIMLRCYQNTESLTHQILKLAQKHILLRKKQMNVIDIGDLCSIYFSATVNSGYKLSPQLQKLITQMYIILKKNMNEVTFQKIWKNLAGVVNKGYLQVQFMQQIIKSLKFMYKKNVFPQRIWKPMRNSFKEFQNLQIRTRLQQIK